MGKPPAVYEVELCLPKAHTSVAEARRFARAALAAWPFAGCHDDVDLVVSELVGNAVRHGQGRPVLRLSGMREWLRVEVSDDYQALPALRESGASGGWGLHLVARLSTAWGATQRDGGKVVWCELAPSSDSAVNAAEIVG